MTEQQVINLINSIIRANGNEEITGSILNSVLLAMVEQPNDLIGDFNNTTVTGDSVVEKINTLLGLINNVSSIKVHTGENDPNITPPASYNVADFYAQTSAGNVIELWQYNGVEWVSQNNIIDDNNISANSTYSSEKIIDLFNSQDGVILVTSINVDNNLVTIGAGSQWRINGNIHSNTNDVTITIPYASIGYVRLDNILGNTSNTFELQQGTQTTGIAVAPLKPSNKVVVTNVSVTENSINSNDNSNVKIKNESGYTSALSVGLMPNIALNNEHSNILITNATEVKSLHFGLGFNVYAGKEVRLIYNGTGMLQVTNNASGADVYSKFIFPYSENYYMLPNEVLTFVVGSDLNSLTFVSSNRRFGQDQVITANTTISNRHHGRTLIINANSTLTYPNPSTLHPNFEMCILTLEYNATNTTPSPWVPLAPNGQNLVHNKIGYVKRVGNNLIFRGEFS